MFFYLSKIFWLVADPGNFLLILLILAVLFLWIGWRRSGRWLATAVALIALVIVFVPVGHTVITNLENRFELPRQLPAEIDGVVVLGGVIDQFVTAGRRQTSTNGAVERLIAMAELAQRYPQARLVFTGGSGVLGQQKLKEADYAGPILAQLGVDITRIAFENQSRNTAENAVFAKKLAAPQADERWILVTSAFHLPRAVGAFRKAGWQIIPYPVDYKTAGPALDQRGSLSDFQLTSRLGLLRVALHELIGLVAYKLTGRSDEFFPGSGGPAGP